MKHFCRVVCVACGLILTSGPVAFAQNLYIYLIGGQSNADSHAPNSGLPAQYQVPLDTVPIAYGGSNPGATFRYTTLRPGTSNYNNPGGLGTSFGLEIGFAWNLVDTLAPGDRIAIIKSAIGGTNLHSHWKAGGSAGTSGDGNVYANFQHVVSLGLSALNNDASLSDYTKVISGMLWTQGEADIDPNHPENAMNYTTNLTRFIEDVRLTYGDIPFHLSRISLNQTAFNSTTNGVNGGPSSADLRDEVRDAQASVANSLEDVYLIETDGPGFTIQDPLHFNANGMLNLGSAFADSVRTSAVPEPSSASVLVLGLLAALGIKRWRFASRR